MNTAVIVEGFHCSYIWYTHIDTHAHKEYDFVCSNKPNKTNQSFTILSTTTTHHHPADTNNAQLSPTKTGGKRIICWEKSWRQLQQTHFISNTNTHFIFLLWMSAYVCVCVCLRVRVKQTDKRRFAFVCVSRWVNKGLIWFGLIELNLIRFDLMV